MLPKKKKLSDGWIATFVILGVIGFVVYWNVFTARSNDSSAPVTAQTPTVDKAAQRAALITEFAPTYCAGKPITMVVEPFKDSPGWPGYDGKRAWTPAECETIIGKLYDAGSNREHLQTVASRKWGIGMTTKELIYSVGMPDDVNSTNFSGYSHQQLVYGSVYIYLENGVVTSYQD